MVVVAFVGVKNFEFAKETTTGYAQAILKSQARVIEGSINLGLENVANIANLAQESLNNPQESQNGFCNAYCATMLNGYLKSVLGQSAYYKNAFIYFFNGMHFASQSGITLSNREILELFKDSNTQAIHIQKIPPKPRDSADKSLSYAPVFLLNTIVHKGEIVGVSGIEFDLEKLGDAVKEIKILESGFVVLLSQDSVVLHHRFFHTLDFFILLTAQCKM